MSACAPSASVRASVDDAWHLADSIRGESASPLHRKIFGGSALEGDRYRAYFERRVTEIRAEGVAFASCRGAVACSSGGGPDGGTIRVSERFAEPALPDYVRLSLLIHEARHAEGATHVVCPNPLIDPAGHELKSPFQGFVFSGQTECDSDENGAYGPQIVLLENIAGHCSSCDASLRGEARAYGDFLISLILSPDAREKLRQDSRE